VVEPRRRNQRHQPRPTCERIHYGIHEAGWQVVREPDGTVVWTSPTGHVYKVPPATYPVDNTMTIKKDNVDDGRGEPPGADQAS
jgi:hypothetical protein